MLDGPRIELEAAALGRDRNAQGVAREEQLGRAVLGLDRLAGPAGLARPVNLQHALPRREVARRRHFLDERLDVRAEELEAAVAGLADQVKVTRMAVRVLEAKTALAEIDLARDAGIDHPLQGAVDRGAADPLILAADEIDEVVGGEVAFLAQEDVDDEVALAGTLAPGRAQALDKSSGSRFHRRRIAVVQDRTRARDRPTLEPRASCESRPLRR